MQIRHKSDANPTQIPCKSRANLRQREGEEEDKGEEEEENGLKKVLPPTRYSLIQAVRGGGNTFSHVTSGGNTFSQPRGGQGVGASSSLGREVPCRGVRKACRGSVRVAILAQLHAACAD